jgi:hypothetical protein
MSTLLQNIANFNPYQINSSRIGIWGSHSVQKLHCGQEQSFGELASSLHFQPHFLTTTEIDRLLLSTGTRHQYNSLPEKLN